MTTIIHNNHATLPWRLADVQPNVVIPPTDSADLEQWFSASIIADSVQLWNDLVNDPLTGDPNIDISLETDSGTYTGQTAVNVIQNLGDSSAIPVSPSGTNRWEQYAESLGQSQTDSHNPQVKLTMTTPAGLPSGTYRVGWYYEWTLSSTSRDFRAQLVVDGTTVMYHSEEPKEHGTSQWHPASGFAYISLSGAKTATLSYWVEEHNKTAYIRKARLELWKVEAS